jgi:hypothetical protein
VNFGIAGSVKHEVSQLESSPNEVGLSYFHNLADIFLNNFDREKHVNAMLCSCKVALQI